jgi:hypothetical protein
MSWAAIAGMVLGGIGLVISGITVYRTRRSWERSFADRTRRSRPDEPGP